MFWNNKKTNDKQKTSEHPKTTAHKAQAKESQPLSPQSKDAYEQGYNKGMDDGKHNRERRPHDLKSLPKLVLFSDRKVGKYIKGYNEGYDRAVKDKRHTKEREYHNDSPNAERTKERLASRERVRKARNAEHHPDMNP